MVGTELFGKSWFRATVACCSVVVLMVFVAGCPIINPPPPVVGPCDDVATACPDDDGDACTTNTCEVVDGAAVCSNTPVACADGEACNAADGSCVADLCIGVDCDDANACTEDSCNPVDGVCANTDVVCPDGEECVDGNCQAIVVDLCLDNTCDDGVFCNGAEGCDAATGDCTAGASPCADGETCDEDTQTCAPDPCAGVDCDDGDACTNDSCTDGACSNDAVVCDAGSACDPDTGDCVDNSACVDVDCDDGDLCTTDTCALGVCSNDAVDCGAGACDPATGDCVDNCVDVDCDDADACTTDTCNPLDGVCSNDAVVCDAGQECDATDGTCVAIVCTVDADCDDGLFCNGSETCDVDTGACVDGTSPCTTDQTCDDDTDACVDPIGTGLDLTSGTDNLTGGAGTDTFDGQRDIVGGNFFQTLNNADQLDGGAGRDTLNAQYQGGGTTTPAALTSMDVINNEITDNNATTLSAINGSGIDEINSASGGAAMTVNNLQTAPTKFGMNNNTQNLIIVAVNTALAGSTDAATLTLNGCTAGTFTFGPASGTNGYESLTVQSDGGIANVLGDITQGGATSLTTVKVLGAQDVNLGAGLDNSVTTVDASGASGKLNVTLGVNTSTATGGSGDDTIVLGANYTTADTVNGGDGSDILSLTTAVAAGTTVVQSTISNVETILVSDAINGNLNVIHFGATNATLTGNTGSATTITMPSGGVFKLAAATQEAITCTASPNTSTDTLSVELSADFDTVGNDNFVATSFETVTVEAKTAARTFGGTVQLGATANTETLNIIGSQNLTVDGVVTADKIDASTLTGTLTLNSAGAGAMVINGGSGADTLADSTGADIVSGNGGNDIINCRAGNDTLNGGAGVDSFVFVDAANDTVNDAGSNVINDFAFGASTDTITLDASGLGALNGGAQNPVTTANYFEGAISSMTAATEYSVVVITNTGYATDDLFETALAAQSTALGDAIVVFFNTTSSRAELYVDSVLGADTNIVAADLIVTFDNVTTLADMANFANTDFIFGA